MLSPQSVLESARCARYGAEIHTDSTIRAVFRQGQLAAEWGYVLPLPLLLDAQAVFRVQVEPAARPCASKPPSMTDYDRLLAGIVQNTRDATRAAANAIRNAPAGTSPAQQVDSFPFFTLLADYWTRAGKKRTGQKASEWAAAYTQLGADSKAPKTVNEFLKSERSTRPKDWGWWNEGNSPPADYDWRLSILWFLAAVEHKRAGWQHERFDHEAAHVFLTGGTKLLDDREKRPLRRPRERKGEMENPMPESYEEQLPRFGQITLGTLAQDEYGEFKIANNSDPRIGNPHTPRPPEIPSIHLCWAIGLNGLTQELAPKRQIPPEQPKVGRQSSLLQSVVALLLDDWRANLNSIKLHVRFFLHCLGLAPAPITVEAYHPGEAWKEIIGSQHEQGRTRKMPPTPVIEALFRRPTHTDLYPVVFPTDERTVTAGGGPRSWWCGVMLKCDLAAFGVEIENKASTTTNNSTEDTQQNQASLRATIHAARYWPPRLSHLIVLDPDAARGYQLCDVNRPGPETSWRGVPLEALTESPPPDGVPYFSSLRTQALGLMFAVLDTLLA